MRQGAFFISREIAMSFWTNILLAAVLVSAIASWTLFFALKLWRFFGWKS